MHLSSPARLKRPPQTHSPIRPSAAPYSSASFIEFKAPQELNSRSANGIIAGGRFSEFKAPDSRKPLCTSPGVMHPNLYRPLVQSPMGTGQPSFERFDHGMVPQSMQQNDPDAQRQQQLFEYQPALVFTGVPRLPPPSYPMPRSHPSLAIYSAESQFPIHSRDVRGVANGCVPCQTPGGMPLRISDAINRPPPSSLGNESLGPNFTINPAVPVVADAWPGPTGYPTRRPDPVQHSGQHPSPIPPPVQNETGLHLPPLRHEASQIPTFFPPEFAQPPVSQPQRLDWPEPPLPSPCPPPYPNFSVVTPKGPRRPRREILAGIKHMIFIWRADAPTSNTYRPRPPPSSMTPHEASQIPTSKTPTYISPAMDPPLLCTFRLAGTYPTIDSQLEQVREKEEGHEHEFPSQTLKHTSPDPRLVGPDGIQWLVEPSPKFPTLRSVLLTAVAEGRARGSIKVEEDDIEVFAQQEVAAQEFPTLPALSYDGSSQSSALPPLASIASQPPVSASHTTAMSLTPQHMSSHIHSTLIPVRAPPSAAPLGPGLDTPRASRPPPSLRPSLADNGRAVDFRLPDQAYQPVQQRNRASRSVRPPPPTSAASSGPSDVLLSKNLMDVLLASVAAPPPKNYVCETCNKAFERRASLETHMTVHNGQRPHKCPVPRCARDFSVRSNFRRHLRTHGLDPRQFDCDQQKLKPETVLEAVKKSSGVLSPSRKRRAVRYSSSNESDLEPDRVGNAGQVSAVAVAAAGAGGNGEQPGGWAPPPSVGPMEEDGPWIPESLRQFLNAHLLSDKPPLDLSRCGATPSMPLPPVHPWGSPTEPSFEERNSFDSNVSETPYHPNQWVYRPRLPGPALSYGDELAQYANRARSSTLSHLS
ncbi:hypothetical protein M407DRAFT_223613 [Tulasnella calospora MUT 4182]|uniref:C2H2-type domain-containing protein n=1 Tax=Tulasnella calospora MUT 4182 TaxID=1051891 RepID=A0A0C3Q6W5_9AGAM|nr:hypothetical protein M407DRAFT_223613 [Tulasnella calospora MUT 4182]